MRTFNITLHIKITVLVAAILFLVAAASACSADRQGDILAPVGNEERSDSDNTFDALTMQEDVGFAMGTVVNQTIYAQDAALPQQILSVLTAVENEAVSWRKDTSQVAKINVNAQAGKSTTIAYETREFLDVALAIAKDSDGAFDITVGNLTKLWDFDSNKNVVPPASKITAARKGVDYAKIAIKGDVLTMQKNASLDLGAIGKGIGADQIEQYLGYKTAAAGALVNIGGSSIMTFGQKPNGDSWKVAITNPTQVDDYLGVLQLDGSNHISTSGDYEKFFEVDGKRYHHILDPHTGYPVSNGLRSVTVVSSSGTISEGLSTACFVLGRQAGLSLLKKYGAEAIFVDSSKQVYLTAGLVGKFQILAEDYKVAAN